MIEPDRVDSSFKQLLMSFDEINLETHTFSVYGLWKNFSLAYFNPAWFTFAKENNGEPIISSKWGLGRNVMESVPPDLKRFYADFFQSCLDDTGNPPFPRKFLYECSSENQFRQFLMTVYPLGAKEGLLIVNALVLEKDHSALSLVGQQELIESDYVDETGIIHQCCHCRKIKHIHKENQWDWVPKWVKAIPSNISHDLCGFCLDYFYPK